MMDFNSDMVKAALWTWVHWLENGGIMPKTVVRFNTRINDFELHTLWSNS